MSNGTESGIIERPKDLKELVYRIVQKDGMNALVMLALMWFIYITAQNQREDQLRMIPVLEKNSEAFNKNSVVLDKTMVVLERIEKRHR